MLILYLVIGLALSIFTITSFWVYGAVRDVAAELTRLGVRGGSRAGGSGSGPWRARGVSHRN